MGLRPQLESTGYAVREVRLVDRRGAKVGGFGVDGWRRFTNGRFTSLPRGDLAQLIYRAIDNDVETIFGDTVTDIVERPESVCVQLQSRLVRSFSTSSSVPADCTRRCGDWFSGQSPPTPRTSATGLSCLCQHRIPPARRTQLRRPQHAGPDDQPRRPAGAPTMFLLIFTSEHHTSPDPHGPDAAKTVLRNAFADGGWECAAILEQLEQAEDIYVDTVSQIVMDHWSEAA